MLTRLERWAIGALVLVAVAAALYFKGHHDGIERTEEKFAAAAAKQVEESRQREQAERDKLLTVSQSYEQQLAQIRVDAANRPARVVRLCSAPTTASMSTTTAAAGESQSSPTPQPSGAPGRNLGPDLYSYADDFKACAVQVNALLDAWPKP